MRRGNHDTDRLAGWYGCLVVGVLGLCLATPAWGQTILYSGGEWDFESGFYVTTHILAGQCSNPPPGGHQSCVPPDFTEYVGTGWLHYASFPPPDWTGPPVGWYTPGHWGIPEFNENKNMANVSRGVRSQEITVTCGNGVGMIYRQVPVPVHHTIRFEADIKFTQSEPYGPNIEPWMGLDPTGNTNPEAGTVVWTPWDTASPLTFHRTQEDIVSTGPVITLFIMMVHREPANCAGGTFMIDDVEVFDMGAIGPAIERSPESLAPAAVVGEDADSHAFTIRNAGSGTLSYTIGDDADWLTLAPVSGSCTTETDTIAVNYNTDDMDVGIYPATITIVASGATNTPQTVAVELTITHKPGDFDGDSDVDQADFGVLQACYSGPGEPHTPECADANLDRDTDVDQDDFKIFKGCFSGPNAASDANCY